MDISEQQFALGYDHLAQHKGVNEMIVFLEANGYNYHVWDTRHNETMIDVLDGDDNKIGEGRVRDYIPRIRLENQNEHLYIGQEIKVTEQEINNLYGRQVFHR